jgi:hypothetical protein
MAKSLRKLTTVIKAKPYQDPLGSVGLLHEKNPTLGEMLIAHIHAMAESYTVGDQTPPVVIIWTDGERRWESVIPDLLKQIPELYAMGELAPEQKTGPAIWLRCILARTISGAPSEETVPIFYVPGVSRQGLRAVEECPPECEPLVALQFSGAVWSHPNGRDWTPLALLSSVHGGLGLDVPQDAATVEALERALPVLLNEKLNLIRNDRLDAPFLNALLAPDLPAEILRWMNDPEAWRKGKGSSAWEAFCAQCVSECHVHPEKDGVLRAAEMLGGHSGEWAKVWKRFAEAPNRYPAIPALLDQAAPPMDGTLGFDREYWPAHNANDEAAVAAALLALKDRPSAEASKVILGLERAHGGRRGWVWRDLGMSPLAVALEPLTLLASLATKPVAGPDADTMARQYVESAWEVDAAVLDALAVNGTHEVNEAIGTALRAVYLPWLDASAQNLQQLARVSPESVKPRQSHAESGPGRVYLFVDGLRFDLAQRVMRRLEQDGLAVESEWDWAAFPPVTATCKSAISPMASELKGEGPEAEFAPVAVDSGHSWTADRFNAYLKAQDIQVLKGRETGDPAGCAWTETGSLDKRGHNDGIKAARSMAQEVQDVCVRVAQLLSAGWTEILLITDHGWLLVPGGLPKVNLAQCLVEHRWGRCAAVKSSSSTDLPVMPWYWNPSVSIATPPGAGCFRAGIEYTHGGISLQEMIVPRFRVAAGRDAVGQARIAQVKWVGLRCRVSIERASPLLKVDVRARPADAKSSKIEGQTPRHIGADGTASVPVENDREEGSAAVVVLLQADGTVVHSIPTIIGENA